ncbi:hypothetical protein AJ88_40910 [Mesorhizobium amorphae CCBAU 01583]|nr:hypothetical protein AJ88_40910 [Mesorhizobium amorphae CCBAU 01583]
MERRARFAGNGFAAGKISAKSPALASLLARCAKVREPRRLGGGSTSHHLIAIKAALDDERRPRQL